MKKIFFVFATLLLLIPGVTELESKAENTYADTSWAFELSGDSSSFRHTEQRSKNTSSSVYFKGRTFTHDLSRVRVQITGYDSNNFAHNRNYYNRIYFYTRNNIEYKLYNTAYENGDSKVALSVKSLLGSGYAGGLWSPDCVGESGIAEMTYTQP